MVRVRGNKDKAWDYKNGQKANIFLNGPLVIHTMFFSLLNGVKKQVFINSSKQVSYEY